VALLALVAAGCRRAPPPPVPRPHFVLGAPYQAGGVWRYPREEYGGSFTGLAVIQPADHPPLTADGEAYDPKAMEAAHPTLQLPAVARVENLETGRETVVRINDRGPADPGRVIAVTPRVAALLGMRPDQPARVRVTLLPNESHRAADDLPGAPRLAIAAAPREPVTVAPLDGTHPAAPIPAPASAPQPVPPLVHLPESVTQYRPDPGQLFVRLSPFTARRYALRQGQQIGGGTAVEPLAGGLWAARLGPFATPADADAALDRAIRAGVTDARIVVE